MSVNRGASSPTDGIVLVKEMLSHFIRRIGLPVGRFITNLCRQGHGRWAVGSVDAPRGQPGLKSGGFFLRLGACWHVLSALFCGGAFAQLSSMGGAARLSLRPFPLNSSPFYTGARLRNGTISAATRKGPAMPLGPASDFAANPATKRRVRAAIPLDPRLLERRKPAVLNWAIDAAARLSFLPMLSDWAERANTA